MRSDQHLILFGASVRAAAGSALRAGLRPWCADRFADADLRAVAPAQRLPGKYPRGFIAVAEQAPPGPWLYTGGLENWPAVVDAIARTRPLWGNGADVLRRVRCPELVARVLREHGIPCPEVRLPGDPGIATGVWLVKPRCGAGGRGIRHFDRDSSTVGRGAYLQQFMAGFPCAAVFVGDGLTAELLGVTSQLVGVDWLHAGPFRYCASIGPLSPDAAMRERLVRLGQALTEGFGLRGLFGVDCVVGNGIPWPVEVNPRYPASVEVLEWATGISALDRHRQIFDPSAEARVPPRPSREQVIGKAILFARDRVRFPADGPWTPALGKSVSSAEMPAFADVPPVGQVIEPGQPIMTIFAAARSLPACLRHLREQVQKLEACLYNSSV